MMTRGLPVIDASQVASARRGAVELASTLGLGEADTGRVAIVASELATNLVRHGHGGILLARALNGDAPTVGVELMALDRGPGMHDVQECLRDGYSTAGTAGTGLGAVRRQSEEFDIYSLPGKGTGVLASVRARRGAGVPPAYGSVSLAKTGEEVCGDGWAISVQGPKISAMVVDGLGHGSFAAAAAIQATALFRQRPFASPRVALQAIHAGLRSTRGAAVAVAFLDAENGSLQFAGIGNIAGSLFANGQTRRLVSLNGIAGHAAQRIQEFVYPYSGSEGLLIMHSDGLAARWSLEQYPGLAARHPSLIAGILFRDFGRDGRDDATVLAARGLR